VIDLLHLELLSHFLFFGFCRTFLPMATTFQAFAMIFSRIVALLSLSDKLDIVVVRNIELVG